MSSSADGSADNLIDFEERRLEKRDLKIVKDTAAEPCHQLMRRLDGKRCSGYVRCLSCECRALLLDMGLISDVTIL